MATPVKNFSNPDPDEVPLSALVAERGIKSCTDFIDYFGALMGDLVSKRVGHETARAACSCGEQILSMVRLLQEDPELDDPIVAKRLKPIHTPTNGKLLTTRQ